MSQPTQPIKSGQKSGQEAGRSADPSGAPTGETTGPSSPAPSVVGISDMARSLAATLEAAPARESRRAAALRQYLTRAARELAALADNPGEHFDAASARLLVEQIRHIATDLATAPPAVPIGIGVVLQAFAAQLLPETLLILRPTGHFHYPFQEELFHFHSLAAKLRLTAVAADGDVPREVLVLRYPQGEQDNVLLSCNLLRAFRPHSAGQDLSTSDAFATRLLGPAYFFALATAMERTAPTHSTATLDQLRYVADLLREAGWFDHPQIAPLLLQWLERSGFSQNVPAGDVEGSMVAKSIVERSVVGSLPTITPHEQEAMHGLPEAPEYLPADFDRDVPRLWDRLRQLLPPNDLELESVESAQPAEAVSILNAGWSFALLHLDDLYRILGSRTAEDRYEAGQVLNRLLTKGIELSYIARLWRKARE